MTRRDYWVNCNEIVHDYNIICKLCSKFCYDCTPNYNLTSGMCILIAIINILCEPTMNIGKLNQLLQF